MHPSRSYTYDEEQAQLSSYSTTAPRSHQVTPNFSALTQTSSQPTYGESRSSYFSQQQFYPNNSGAINPREGAPHAPAPVSRYLPTTSYSNNQTRSVGYKPTLSPSYSSYLYETPYGDSSQFPAPGQFSANQDMERAHFIPTPSEMAHVYPSHPGNSRPMMPSHHSLEPDSRQLSRASQRLHAIPTTASHMATHVPNASLSSTSSPTSTERYPCEKCGKTFSRSHDRKRHYETQHHPVPVIHRCRFCEKEFSRADSLKRHLDNGCDEMP